MEATLVLEETQELVVVGQLVVGGTAHLVHQGTSTVGRSPSSTIVLPQEAVSKDHAVMEASAACTTIQDAGSANGTKKNGSRLAPGVEHVAPQRRAPGVGLEPGRWRDRGQLRRLHHLRPHRLS